VAKAIADPICFESGPLTVTFKSGVGVAEGGTASLLANTNYYISVNC